MEDANTNANLISYDIVAGDWGLIISLIRDTRRENGKLLIYGEDVVEDTEEAVRDWLDTVWTGKMYASGKIYGTGFPYSEKGLRLELANVTINPFTGTASGEALYFGRPRVLRNGMIHSDDRNITGNMLVYNSDEPEVICLEHVTVDRDALKRGERVTFTYEKRTMIDHPYKELIEGLKEG